MGGHLVQLQLKSPSSSPHPPTVGLILKLEIQTMVSKLTMTNEEMFAVDGRVKLAVSSYLAPLETCLRLISRFEQSGRQKVIHRIFQ